MINQFSSVSFTAQYKQNISDGYLNRLNEKQLEELNIGVDLLNDNAQKLGAEQDIIRLEDIDDDRFLKLKWIQKQPKGPVISHTNINKNNMLESIILKFVRYNKEAFEEDLRSQVALYEGDVDAINLKESINVLNISA